jgi:hypothetical protein
MYVHFVTKYRISQITYKKCDISPFTRGYHTTKEAEETDDYSLIISILNPTVRRKLIAFFVSNVEGEFKILLFVFLLKFFTKKNLRKITDGKIQKCCCMQTIPNFLLLIPPSSSLSSRFI